MTKNKLIELRCKAWGITEDEYYCNQCSDFSLEDMARAYRRGKNKGRAELEKENAELKKQLGMGYKVYNDNLDYSYHIEEQLTKAKEIIKKFLDVKNIEDTCVAESEAEHFLQELSELQTVSIDRSEI